MTDTLVRSDLPLPLVHRGKVREVYAVGEGELLMVASDRVSAFDVVMEQPIPRKGEVLNLLTDWWLTRLERDEGIEHHRVATDPDTIVRRHPELATSRELWARRAMLVRRTSPIPVECVVRGYLSGSAWREYRAHQTLAGEALPSGMIESQKLDEPLFSPATKAVEGHDENITQGAVTALLGEALARRLASLSQRIFSYGSRVCEAEGIILADTKFEFGIDADGRLLLIDEVMTPDSSRFWPRDAYAAGRGQPSLDKQPLRDWLDGLPEWDKAPPPPPLPDQVVAASSERYLEVFRRLTGMSLGDYHAVSSPAANAPPA